MNIRPNLVVPQTETKISVQQSLKQAQELLSASFNCISYLRELFPESAFVPDRTNGLELKKLAKGASTKTDRLLEWIEKGCGDALERQYLKSVTMTIFSEKANPKAVIESYSMNVVYPNSELHKCDDSGGSYPSLIAIQHNKGTIKAGVEGADFKKAATSLLRQLCVLTQTLPILPRKKYLQLSISYYDFLTPTTYVPPGFKSIRCTDEEMKRTFKGPKVTQNFGEAMSSFHRLILLLERRQGDNYDDVQDLTLPDTASQQLTIGGFSQNPDPKEAKFPEIVKSKNLDAESENNAVPSTAIPSPKSEETQKALTFETPLLIQPKLPGYQANTGLKDCQNVNCLCGDNQNDLDMIQCERCNLWQHTVCVGYYSNRDPRIHEEPYGCYDCKFKCPQELRYLKDLCIFRRALSVAFNENVNNVSWLTKRLKIQWKRAKKYFTRLQEEGFIIKVEKTVGKRTMIVYEALRTKHIRDKLRKYFETDLKKFPEFTRIQRFSESAKAAKISKDSGSTERMDKPVEECKRTKLTQESSQLMAVASVLSCISDFDK